MPGTGRRGVLAGFAAAVVSMGLAGCSSPPAKTAHSATTSAPTTSTSTTSAAVSSSTPSSTAARATTTSTTVRATTTTAPPRTVTAGPANNGQTINLHVGDTLEVVLSGCGGCGYEWEMTGQPSPVVFRYEGESTTATTTTTGAAPVVGTPVTYTWSFKALSAHTTGFVAGYYPPSQKQPSQTYTLRLVVSP
ncbi:MAG: protease inhibitor I42 family protein [Acidimicrobiales bacterium]